jgi:hypothetical protein
METGQATAERAADALVVFILRWGTPDTMWQAHDSQLQSEVVRRVCERLDIKIMSTTPYNKNATAKPERKHLLVAQILKRLHGGHPNTWDQHLPLAEHRLRNTTLVHAGYTPWEMIFGRSPKVPSAVNHNQDAMKEHPRARAYLGQPAN